jgi:uncharacterized protein YjeT (DUF2065 family)
MIIVLYVIAILFTGAGVLLVLYTEEMNGFLKKLLSVRRVKLLAAIPLVFGIGLIAGSLASEQIFWLALVLGLLALLKGMYMIIAPSTQIKALIDRWFTNAGYRIMRLYGLIVFVLGIAILSQLF